MEQLAQFLVSHGGTVVFFAIFAEQAGLPIPAAPWLLAAGALSARGQLSPAVALGAAFLACVSADTIWFYIGRRGGKRVLRFFCRLSLAQNSCVGRTEQLFRRYGVPAVVAAKFLPGLGAVMPPLAGAFGLSASSFLVLDSLGSLIYGLFYLTLGFLFGQQLQQMLGFLHELGFSFLLLAAILLPAYIAWKYSRRRKAVPERRRLEAKANYQMPPEAPTDAGLLSPAVTLAGIPSAELPAGMSLKLTALRMSEAVNQTDPVPHPLPCEL